MVQKLSQIPGHSSIPEDYTSGCPAGGELSIENSVSVDSNEIPMFQSPSIRAIRVNEEAEKDLVRNLLLNETILQGLDLVAQVAKPLLGAAAKSSKPSKRSTGLLAATTFHIDTFRLNMKRGNTKSVIGQDDLDEWAEMLGQDSKSSTSSSSMGISDVEELISIDYEFSRFPDDDLMLPVPQNSSKKFMITPPMPHDAENMPLRVDTDLPMVHTPLELVDLLSPVKTPKTPAAKTPKTPARKIPTLRSHAIAGSFSELRPSKTNSPNLFAPRTTTIRFMETVESLDPVQFDQVESLEELDSDALEAMRSMSTAKTSLESQPTSRKVGPTWPTFRGTMRSFANFVAPTLRECDFDENAISNPEEIKLDHSKGTAIGNGGYSWVTEYVIIFFPPALLISLIVSDIANACTKGFEWISAWTVFWAVFRIASAVFMASCFHAYLHIISTPTVYHALPLPVSCAVVALVGPLVSSSFYFSRWWYLSVILGVGSAITIHSVRTMLSSGEAFFLSYDLGSSSMGKSLKAQIRQNLKTWFVSLADVVTVLWLVYPFFELARIAAEQMNADWTVLVASLYKISVLWLQITNISGMFRDLSSEICLLNFCYPLIRHFLLGATEDFTAVALLYTTLASASFFFTNPKEFRSTPGFVLIFSLNIWFYGFDGVSMVDILFGWRYMVFWHLFTKFSHWVQRMRHSILYRMAYCHDMSANTKTKVEALHSLNCQHFIRFENWFLNFVMHCLKVWDVTILLRMTRDFKPVRYEEEELRVRLGTQMLNTSMLLTFTGTEEDGKVGVFKFKNMMFPLAAPTVEYLREMVVKVDLKTRMLLDFEGTMDTYSMEMLRFCIHEHRPSKAVAPTIDFIYKLREKHPQVKRMFREYERKFHCDLNKYEQKVNVKTTGWSRMAAMLDTLFAFGTHPVVHGFGGSYEDESLFGTHTHAMTHGNNFLGESSNFVIATLCASHVPVEAISLSVVNNEQNFPETFFQGACLKELRHLENVSLLAKIHNITIDNLLKVWRKCDDAPYKPSDGKLFRKMAVYFINNSIMHSLDHALQYKISSFRHYMNDLDFHRYQPAAVSARYLTEQIPGTGERTSNWAPFVGWVQEWHERVVADMKIAGIHDPKQAEAKYGLWGDIEDVDLCIDF